MSDGAASVIERTVIVDEYCYALPVTNHKHGGCHEFLISTRFSDPGLDDRGRFSADRGICCTNLPAVRYELLRLQF